MLARGATAKVASRNQNLTAPGSGLIENEFLLGFAIALEAPVGKQVLTQAFLGCGGQKPSGNDLIGIDIGVRQNDCCRLNRTTWFHQASSRGSVILTQTAAAAAVAGLASSVRAPTPWRPSKLRLLVLTVY